MWTSSNCTEFQRVPSILVTSCFHLCVLELHGHGSPDYVNSCSPRTFSCCFLRDCSEPISLSVFFSTLVPNSFINVEWVESRCTVPSVSRFSWSQCRHSFVTNFEMAVWRGLFSWIVFQFLHFIGIVIWVEHTVSGPLLLVAWVSSMLECLQSLQQMSANSTAFSVISSLLWLWWSDFGTSTSSMQRFVPRQIMSQVHGPGWFNEGISIPIPQVPMILKIMNCWTRSITVPSGITPTTVDPFSFRSPECSQQASVTPSSSMSGCVL